MRKLQRRLKAWVDNHLISEEQKIKIQQFEEKRSSIIRPQWILYGFVILGGSVIGIGIISLIASNWEDIPGSVKLLVDLFVLVGIAVGIMAAETHNKPLLFDTQAVLFVFLCIASIGLISQVYHTGGELYQALIMWSVITFPICASGKKMFLSYFWVTGFITLCLVWCFSDDSWWSDNAMVIVPFLALPFLCLVSGLLFRLITSLKRFGSVFYIAGVLSFIYAGAMTDVILTCDADEIFGIEWIELIPLIVIASIAYILLAFASGFRKKEKWVIAAASLFTLCVWFLPKLFWSGSAYDFEDYGPFLGPVYSVITLCLLAIFFSIRGQKRLFHLTTLTTGIRFLIVYFDVLESLAFTGIGLVVSGFIILGATTLWYKSRTRIDQWIGGLVK